MEMGDKSLKIRKSGNLGQEVNHEMNYLQAKTWVRVQFAPASLIWATAIHAIPRRTRLSEIEVITPFKI